MKVIFICGLPASGKTFLANVMISTSYKDYILIDDIKDKNVLIEQLVKDKNCIITDPYFCISSNRNAANKLASFYNADIEWIFFENDPIQCLENAKNRENKPVKFLIEDLSKVYSIPDVVEVRKIFNHK